MSSECVISAGDRHASKRDHGIAVALVSMPAKKREDLKYFTTKFKIS